MDGNRLLSFGSNAGYLTELYQLYLSDPTLLEPEWVEFFNALDLSNDHAHTNGNNATVAPESSAKYISTSNNNALAERVVDGFRRYGHLAARVSPLVHGGMTPISAPELHPSFYGEAQSAEAVSLSSYLFGAKRCDSLAELIRTLSDIYCGSIGFEFSHITSTEEREWLRKRIEQRLSQPCVVSKEVKVKIFLDLMRGELFESELHRKYVGAKRFSCEGNETILPALSTVIRDAAAAGLQGIIFGMAHRGRLNILTNIINKPLEEIFEEFEDLTIAAVVGAGDVKYHLGYESVCEQDGKAIKLMMIPNPSHLEFVNPVVEGIARALQDKQYDRDRRSVLPLVLHGDAALAGQGVAFETINFSGLEGYSTGGTLHIVTNNQIGFTTTADESRSTRYCTDLAKGIDAPIFHVNCEDPEGACWTVALALEYRNTFGKDVFVDLIGHRKHGHNEGDDPSFTQPLTYAELKGKRPIWQQYGEQLLADGVVDQGWLDTAVSDYKAFFASAHERISTATKVELSTMRGQLTQLPNSTGVKVAALKRVARALAEFPEGFVPHAKLAKIIEKRVESVESGKGIEWGVAEALAFGSLVLEGRSVRFSGQDSGRGTFSQRHLLLDNFQTGDNWSPLQALAEREGSTARFELYNSPLSEAAVIGFEFGYAATDLHGLTIWEAQFGDFANGAQVVLDQFLSSSEAKWGQLSGLTLMLPHGYEGQGPEHSSARLERYLQMCAEYNMRVCYPSTAAQHFHLLRRQALTDIKRPLIIMTPKSLLRLPSAMSALSEMSNGSFRPVIEDNLNDGATCRNVVLLSGKVYHDVQAALKEHEKLSARIVRVEELYPFPQAQISEILKKSGAERVIWLQEEPQNMGAWTHVAPYLRAASQLEPLYIGRPASAATSTGSSKHHVIEQRKILSELISYLTEGPPNTVK